MAAPFPGLSLGFSSPSTAVAGDFFQDIGGGVTFAPDDNKTALATLAVAGVVLVLVFGSRRKRRKRRARARK